MYAAEYARAVEPMSPRLPSAITSRPARRAYAQICSNAAIPADPSASKNASCGLTATACGRDGVDDPAAEARDVAAQLDRQQIGRGSSPTTSWLRFRSTSAATRSPKVSVATAIDRRKVTENGGGPLAPPSGKPSSVLLVR